jgi:8-oxo-dGTP diphosphatase
MDKRRINVRAIIWSNGKLLAVKHKTHNGSEVAYWALPGGGLDPFESLEEGIVREMIEETGITPTVGRLLFGQQMLSGRAGRDEEMEFFYHVTNPEAYESIVLSTTSHGTLELDRCEFIDIRTEHILPDFLKSIDIEKHINEVQHVVIVNNLKKEVI